MSEKWINRRQVALLGIELLAFAISLRIANNPEIQPIVRNVAFGCTMVLAFLLYCSVKRVFSKTVRSLMFQKAKGWMGAIFGLLSEIASRWLPERDPDKIRIYGKDRRSFIFGSLHKERKRRFLRNPQKWADQTDNSKRVRYLYTEYLIRKIRRGYAFHSHRTPKEISKEITKEITEEISEGIATKIDNDSSDAAKKTKTEKAETTQNAATAETVKITQAALFEIYQQVRYDQGAIVQDETIRSLREFLRNSKK
jgi:hypothetical protein